MPDACCLLPDACCLLPVALSLKPEAGSVMLRPPQLNLRPSITENPRKPDHSQEAFHATTGISMRRRSGNVRRAFRHSPIGSGNRSDRGIVVVERGQID